MIRVANLSKRFGAFTAVRNVTFEIRRGEVFAFLGPNGSGKTTTLKTMAGLAHPSEGTVHIGGYDMSREPLKARQLFSYLPQRVSFPEQLSPREILRFYARVRGIPQSFAEEALRKAQWNGFADKPVGQFSGGMIQRLGMSVASIADAPILFLDEPTANLDPQGVKRFREFILEQKSRQKTVIFTTHLLDEAEQLADRVGIFVSGAMVACESVDLLRTTVAASASLEDAYIYYVEKYDNEHR